MVLGVLLVITLIQILPQVDLPDTAFQEDSAPVAIHARATSPPLVLASGIILPPSLQPPVLELLTLDLVPAHAAPNFLPIFYRSIRV